MENSTEKLVLKLATVCFGTTRFPSVTRSFLGYLFRAPEKGDGQSEKELLQVVFRLPFLKTNTVKDKTLQTSAI